MTAALLLMALLAQAGQQPPRDRPGAREPATASLEGRVLDAQNQAPLRRAIVRLSGPGLPQPLTIRTDQSGRYVFGGLAPGRYTLSASRARYLTLQYGQRRPFEQGRRLELAAKQALTNVDVMLPRAAVISGKVIEPGGDPIDRMFVILFRTAYANGRQQWVPVTRAATNDVGEYRLSGLAPGEYYLMTIEMAVPPTEFTDDAMAYGRTFYPSTADRSEAQRLRLELGQEIVNLDIPVVVSRTATLSGTAVREDGTPITGTRVNLLSGPESGIDGSIEGGATLDPQGRFRIAGVSAGAYQLVVNTGDDEGVLPVLVSGSDQSGLTIVAGKGGTLNGRVVSSTGGPLPFSTGAVQLAARTTGDSWQYRRSLATLKPDWTFAITGVQGPRVIRATRLPDGWWLKAVMRGDSDVTDVPMDIAHGDAVDGYQVVLDNHPTDVNGSVKDAAGATVADYTVIVFSEDASKWGAETRFVRAERPDHAGTFSVKGLPPGPYLIAAVEYVEEGQWLDRAYLESLRPRARKLLLEPEQKTTLELQVVK